MSNRHSIPPVDGVASVWANELGHTMMIGTTGAGKTALYGMLRLTEAEFRIVKGTPEDGVAGDEACA